MRLYILTLLVCWALSLTTPPVVIAEPFSSPSVKHGVGDLRVSAHLPRFEKKTFPRHWRHGHHRFTHISYIRDTRYSPNRTSPPPKTVYKEPFVLNPEIFNPSPKTPLTLVIEDGVVVDSYRGY
jgi:hypothetical protein